MSCKITVIGAGNVGATVAYTLSRESFVTEIVMIDINKEKAFGEVMDMEQGTCFRSPISLKAGDYEDAEGSDLVVITSGIGRKPGQTRLELTQTNVNIMKDIAQKIPKHAPDAKYVIVANPVDILTYVFTKISGIPESQILGSGTQLDTARLRFMLSEEIGLSQSNIHAYVLGEHGDTSFVPWSACYVGGQQLDAYVALMEDMGEPIHDINRDEVMQYVRKSGGTIIANKGATFYGVAASVCNLCKILMSAKPSTTTVSTMLHGEYGIEDVCLSMLVELGPNGVEHRIPFKMTDEEVEMMKKSAAALKDVIAQVEI